jgi:hypothetical protein
MVAPLYCYTGKVGPRFGMSESLEEWKWSHNVTTEANTYLRPLHTSILDIYSVLSTLVHCLKCIGLHPYTVTWAKLAPDLVFQDHLRSDNDVIMPQLRLISTSDLFIDTYYIYIKCVKHWHAVSSAYGCAPILLHGQSWHQFYYVRGTIEEWKWSHNITIDADTHLRPQTSSYIHIRHI